MEEAYLALTEGKVGSVGTSERPPVLAAQATDSKGVLTNRLRRAGYRLLLEKRFSRMYASEALPQTDKP